MSDADDLSGLAEALAEGWPLALYANYINLSAYMLYIYDYILTFSQERSEIWTSKFSGAAFLFFLNRYSFLLNVIISLIFYKQPLNDKACYALDLTSYILLILNFFAVILLFSLRTYAIYQKNNIILFGLLAVGFAKMTTDFWFTIEDSAYGALPVQFQVGPYSCTNIGPSPVTENQCKLLITPTVSKLLTRKSSGLLSDYALSLAFDSLVFLLTCGKTIRLVWQMKKLDMKQGLLYQLLRDGTLYYLPITLLAIAGIVVIILDDAHPDSQALSYIIEILGPFNQVLIAILVNRLVLNLRHVARVGPEDEGKITAIGHSKGLAEPIFASRKIVGNLGAPLRSGFIDEDDDFDDYPEFAEGGLGQGDSDVVGADRDLQSGPEIHEQDDDNEIKEISRNEI